MNNKNILIFSTAYHPFVGGAEVSIKELTDRLSGFEFDLITARFDKKLPFREKVGNVTVYRLGIGVPIIDKLILPFEGALFARHLAKKKKYDAFWCVMASFASGAAYIFNIFSKNKVPIILNLQEGDSEEHFKNHYFGLVNLSWKLALKRTNYLTVLSQYLKDRAIRLGYKGKVDIVPNGVDVEKFELRSMNYESRERQEVREELGLKEGEIGLITTSRLVEKNGVGDVIKALPLLDSNIKFVICGEGDLKDGLISLAKKLRVGERVVFKGNVQHSVLNKYLKACDIFIRPSLSEGFGISFIEAMAAKIPVIATPVGGIPDFLEDPTSQSSDVASVQTGYFCEPNNPSSVATTIQRVINDPQKNTVIENAIKMVKEKYDWDLVAVQMRGVFDSI